MDINTIKLGMIGGGPDSFIGAVHRNAAWLDGQFELVGGAFSSNPEKSRQTGDALGLDPERVYGSYHELFEKERELPEDLRIDAVAIVTPNHLHTDPAIKALDHELHVIIDKPLAYNLEEAKRLRQKVEDTGLVLALTHTYTGYPMVKEAKHQVSSGKLGSIRKVLVEYPQGWLASPLEQEDNKQADWRTDPERSGTGGAIGDIGTHAANLAEYVSGLKITQLCADLNTVVDGRTLDDDASALLKFENGASGVLVATQVAAGEENDLNLRVYGELGGLEWSHTDPNTLQVKMLNEPTQLCRTGTSYLSDIATQNTRLPAGHPEGFIEAFANIYSNFAEAVRDYQLDNLQPIDSYDFPTVEDGVRGMAFIETMVESDQSDQKWTDFVV